MIDNKKDFWTVHCTNNMIIEVDKAFNNPNREQHEGDEVLMYTYNEQKESKWSVTKFLLIHMKISETAMKNLNCLFNTCVISSDNKIINQLRSYYHSSYTKVKQLFCYNRKHHAIVLNFALRSFLVGL